jgi:hypothetical protein
MKCSSQQRQTYRLPRLLYLITTSFLRLQPGEQTRVAVLSPFIQYISSAAFQIQSTVYRLLSDGAGETKVQSHSNIHGIDRSCRIWIGEDRTMA